MKLIIITLLMLFSLNSISQTKKLLASCCEKKEGRCTGSASCSVCTNCSRCGYCNSGGSCGVCGSGSRNSYYSAPRKSKPKRANKVYYTSSYSYHNTTNNYNYETTSNDKTYETDQVLETTIENVNVREDAGTQYKIIEKLQKGATVYYKGKIEEWIEVEVIETGTMGYINQKYLH